MLRVLETSAPCEAGPIGSPGARRGWIDEIEATLSRSRDQLRPDRPPWRRDRIVIFSVVPWHHGVMEHMLAISLRLKGAWVRTVICSGDWPACGMESSSVPRPPCAQCLTRAERYMRCFDLDYDHARSYVSPQDIARARSWAAAVPRDGLATAEYEGVQIGAPSYRDLSQYFHYLVRELTFDEEAVLRRFLAASALNVELARRVRVQHDPTCVILSNGKSVAYSGLYLSFRAQQVETVSWDESPMFRDAYTFNRNCFASEVHLEDEWPAASGTPLSPAQRRALHDYFGAWRRGDHALCTYHDPGPAAMSDLAEVVKRARKRRIIAFFSNLTWETSHLGRDIGFAHLLDAVHELIDYVGADDRYHLVIRAHPGEVKLPGQVRTRIPLDESIRRRFGRLPDNVTVLSGGSPVRSYDLAQRSDVNAVYTSTLGCELAVDGHDCLVLADCHYRNKGFTTDISSAAELRSVLRQRAPGQRLDGTQQELAARYAYLWLFRHVVRVPYLDASTRLQYRIGRADDLCPGSGSVIDRLTDCILEKSPFLDISNDCIEDGNGLLQWE